MSEMLQETEEEEIDEETSIDGLDDVEKFLHKDDDSDFEKDEVREVLAAAWKQKRQEISKERDYVEGSENSQNQ